MEYAYRLVEIGKVVLVRMSIAEMERRQDAHGYIVLDDGRAARRDYMAESTVGTPALAGWPKASEALAVHPDQIEEARRDARFKGVPTEFDGVGRPVFENASHQSRYVRAYGYFNKDGGYRD